MLHDPDLLAARLNLLALAPEGRTGRVETMRKLFAAAGCQQISEFGDEDGRNVECTAPGTGDGVIVVGTSQAFDSLGTLALLPSLAEAVAAAPRRHTFRWVAFSPHVAIESGESVPKPRGAVRLWKAMARDERAKVEAMIHLGPLGFGPVREHPDAADTKLHCVLEEAARVAGIEFGAPLPTDSDCRIKQGAGPGGRLPALRGGANPSMITCSQTDRWQGAPDWVPFRRADVRVFSVHSRDPRRSSAELDSALYLKTYRALAIFLALADETLAPGVPPTEVPRAAAATSGD